MRSGTAAAARDPAWVAGSGLQRSVSETLFRYVDPGLAAVTWAMVQSAALITIAVFLVFVILPAVLAAAGAQVSGGP